LDDSLAANTGSRGSECLHGVSKSSRSLPLYDDLLPLDDSLGRDVLLFDNDLLPFDVDRLDLPLDHDLLAKVLRIAGAAQGLDAVASLDRAGTGNRTNQRENLHLHGIHLSVREVLSVL
jgi:hypothetical protein